MSWNRLYAGHTETNNNYSYMYRLLYIIIDIGSNYNKFLSSPGVVPNTFLSTLIQTRIMLFSYKTTNMKSHYLFALCSPFS